MKKYLILVLAAAFAFFNVYAQENSEAIVNAAASDDIDSLFEDAEDVDEPVHSEEATSARNIFQKLPITFSGQLDSEVGAGYIYEYDKTNKPTAYFDLKNYLYLNAKPIKELGVHCSVLAKFPSIDFSVNEFYFDYIFLGACTFTAGKKATTWGYPRLFCTSTLVQDDNKKNISYEINVNTNLLYNSINGTSFILNVPLDNVNIMGYANYNGSDSNPSMDELTFAGSFEVIVFDACLNLFGYKEPASKVNTNGGPVFGIEAKRTCWGFDVYGQGMARFYNDNEFDCLFDGHSLSFSSLKNLCMTCGFYRFWQNDGPSFGFNIEYQGVCVTNSDSKTYDNKFYNSFAYQFLIYRLGKSRRFKVGLEGYNNIENKNGYIKPGFIISGILPNCDLDTGLKWEYGKDYASSGKFTFGTYIKLSIGY